ncbi:S-adenosyl-L-methionine-dependent methyltransferase [Rhizoctonia solani]|nr:S-adenosyl-L-methionine-dependent methyltransferase [Rhizoctonia solani]
MTNASINRDHVPPPSDQAERIEKAIGRQQNSPVPKEESLKYNVDPASYWDRFYQWNEGNFFRDRKWLHQEFPELTQLTDSEAGPATVVEIGCGAGNTVFPLLESNQNPKLNIIGCDYSSKAIEVVKAHPLYTANHIGTVSAHVWDLAGPILPPDVDSGTVDVVVMVFVLSALHPKEWTQAITNVYSMLKPGGLVVLRDYGRYDLTQLRFKEGRLLSDNFYVRGDGTRVYFFDLGECDLNLCCLRGISGEAPLPSTNGVDRAQTAAAQLSTVLGIPHPLFSITQLGVDRRLLVNRKRQLQMYRVWMQGKFRKN